jgi:hypothetical protein
MAVKSQNEPENPVIDTAIMNISPIEPIFDRKKLLEMTASWHGEHYPGETSDKHHFTGR